MRPFVLERATDPQAALHLGAEPGGQFLAGGTNLLDLMKIDVARPTRLTEIGRLRARYGAIESRPDGLHLGALARMSDAAAHDAVRRDYPVLASTLLQAANAQLRNMATLGGNVLQRTRCNYFRDPSWAACNKRESGSGCAALTGVNRRLAVLGVSEHCIAHYPGDFAIGLVALGAEFDVLEAGGQERSFAFEELHRLPGDRPDMETTLPPGALTTRFRVPAGPWTARSLYLKVRDRSSFDFALASAAVALHLDGDTVFAARIWLGGLVAKPWRARTAEAALAGRRLDEDSAQDAAEAEFQAAVTHGENAFKPELGRRTLVRALLEAAQMEIGDGR